MRARKLRRGATLMIGYCWNAAYPHMSWPETRRVDQPTIDQFGLTETDVAREAAVERKPDRIRYFVLAGVGIGALVGLFGYQSGEWETRAAFARTVIGAGVGALWGSMSWLILTASYDALRKAMNPAARNYHRFLQANRAYQEQEHRKQLEFWRALSGAAFEGEFAKLLIARGYEVRTVGGRNDGGIDLIARRGGRTTIVQCKAWSKLVGPAVVRELYGTLIASHADAAILATTGDLSEAARAFIEGKPIQVYMLHDLVPPP